MTMTEQERLDRENPYWNPAWVRKQKRTAGQKPPAIQQPTEDIAKEIKKLLPNAALKRHSSLTPEEFQKLLEALEFYAFNDPYSTNAEEFIVRHTKLEPNFIPNYFSNHKENPIVEASQRLYSRARKLFEFNITRVHIHSNSQFAQFILSNRYGYASKPEGGNQTQINIDARSFLQQLGRLPEDEQSKPTKAIEAKATNEPAKLPQPASKQNEP